MPGLVFCTQAMAATGTQAQRCRRTQAGAWSLGRSHVRGWRSMPASTTACCSGDETRVKATIKGNASDHRILSLACLDGSDIFMYSLDNGYDYAMYTVSMRDNEHQEILILSYDKRTTGKTNLNGISVIGNDSVNRVALLPLQGFRQVSVLNSPLQIKSDRTAQLYRDKLRAMVTIAWDEKGKSFRVSGIED